MHFKVHIPILVCILANASSADAGLLARSFRSFIQSVKQPFSGIHQQDLVGTNPKKVKDLRLAFSGMLYAQDLVITNPQKAYCVSRSSTTGGLGGGTGTTNNDASAPDSTSVTSSGANSDTRLSGAAQIYSSTSSSPAATDTGSTSPSLWKVFKFYQGDAFFDTWRFFTESDPTHGTVDFVDRKTAELLNLIEVNSDGNAILRVETTARVSTTRKSVWIVSPITYDVGTLVVLDAVHMPTGCATWPAFCSVGPDWPMDGEISIVEGINTDTANQAKILTNPGCTISSSDSSQLGINGIVVDGTDCAADMLGCGVVATQANTFGVGFNNNGGGVYAMQWVESGISVWFFPRGSIPFDISSSAPVPENWGMPMAHWPASGCDPSKFFNRHTANLLTTLCGEWAGENWDSMRCAADTGVSTCEQYVQNNGAAFIDAYWEVKYVRVYAMDEPSNRHETNQKVGGRNSGRKARGYVNTKGHGH